MTGRLDRHLRTMNTTIFELLHCRHPYLLNVKILPLQFAKNAVKGKLPLYDWRKVLRDLRTLVGEEAESKVETKPGKRTSQNPEKPFTHARKMGAAVQQASAV